MKHYAETVIYKDKAGGNAAAVYQMSITEMVSIAAYRNGFVDVDIDVAPGKTRIMCSDYTGKAKATFTGKTLDDAADKLMEAFIK